MIDLTNPPTTVGWRFYVGAIFIAVGMGIILNSPLDAVAAYAVASGLFFVIRSSIYGN